MKFHHYLLAATFLILLSTCQKEAPTPLLPNELPTPDAIKAYFNQAWAESRIVAAIDSINVEGVPYCRFTFEDGEEVVLKKEWTTEVVADSSNWSAQLMLQDGDRLPAYILGDTLYIDSVTVDPFGNAPLSAMIKAEMPVRGRFGVTVLGRGADGIPIGHVFDTFAYEHRLPVLGLYPEYENEVEVAFLSPEGQVRVKRRITITTGSVSGRLTIDILHNELPPDDDGIFFVSDIEKGFDQRGELRWAYTGRGLHLYQKLANGNFAVSDREGGVSYHSATFSEISMLGEVVQQYEVPNLMHHEIREMPNGNFLVATNSSPFTNNRWDGELEEDVIIEVDRATGEIVKSWDLNLILDNQRPRADGVNNDDWLHLNAVYYDEEGHAIVFSGRHQSVVAKIGYEQGDLKWILAHPAGWGAEQAPFVLTPVNADGTPVDLGAQDFLPYFLHYPAKLPNGNILLFDNGNYRNFYEDPEVEEESYSRAVEYEINPEEGTVRKVWEFNYDKSIFNEATGSVQYLPENGHRLIGFMNGTADSPKVVELDEAGNIVFEANVNRWSDYYRCEKYGLYDGM